MRTGWEQNENDDPASNRRLGGRGAVASFLFRAPDCCRRMEWPRRQIAAIGAYCRQEVVCGHAALFLCGKCYKGAAP
jgi:hypothetical protein